MRLPVTFGAILALALVGGCGGGSASPTSPGPSAAGPTPTAAAQTPTPAAATPTPAAQAIVCNAAGSGTAVEIQDFAFNPASANVSSGGLVTWSNGDNASHTVSFDDGPDCGTVSGGGTTTAQFNVAGSYSYHCKIHPSMEGTIVVG